MHERLRSLLTGISTSEQSDLIVRAVALIEERGFTDFQDSLEQDIAGLSSQPGEITQHLITQRLIPFYSDILQNMGLELTEGTDLCDYIDILQWLCGVENFDDTVTLNNIAISDNDDAEILADILAVVSAQPSDAIFPLLDVVSPYLIRRIAELTKVEDLTAVERSPTYAATRARLQKVLALVMASPEYAGTVERISSILRIDRDPGTMLPEIQPLFMSFSRHQSAAAIALVFAASNVPDAELLPKASVYVQSVTGDVSSAILTVRIITSLLVEISIG